LSRCLVLLKRQGSAGNVLRPTSRRHPGHLPSLLWRRKLRLSWVCDFARAKKMCCKSLVLGMARSCSINSMATVSSPGTGSAIAGGGGCERGGNGPARRTRLAASWRSGAVTGRIGVAGSYHSLSAVWHSYTFSDNLSRFFSVAARTGGVLGGGVSRFRSRKTRRGQWLDAATFDFNHWDQRASSPSALCVRLA